MANLMKTSEDRILTTHAGSLVRPPEVVEAMIAEDLGRPIDDDSFTDILQKSVADVVRHQAGIGLDVIDDGEFGKSNWIAYVTARMDGLDLVTRGRGEGVPQVSRPEGERYGDFYRIYHSYECSLWLPETPSRQEYIDRGAAFQVAVCNGPVNYRPEALLRDLKNLKTALADVDVTEAFVPVAAPCSIEYMPNNFYKSREEYLFAIAEALAVEYQLITDAGFLLQVDDAILPMQYFMKFRDKSLAEYRKWAELRIEALNHALKQVPEDRVRYHVCFGSQNIPHTTDPKLKDIIDLVLKVNAQAYSVVEGARLASGKLWP